MDQAPGASAVLERSRALTVTLNALAETLAAGDPAAVLDGEAPLQAALAALSLATDTPRLDPDSRASLRADIAQCRAALVQCRALGSRHRQITDATLVALGRHGGYGPQGVARAPRPTRGTDVQVRG